MATLEQAKQQIEKSGADLPDGHPVADGKIHRYGPQKKYWYKLVEFIAVGGAVLVSGTFGFWQGDIESVLAIATDWAGVSADERAAAERKWSELQQRDAQKKEQAASNAAIRASQQWRDAAREGDSPYVQRKQITAPGIRYQPDGTLLVPAVVVSATEPPRLVGLQKIAPDGVMRFSGGMAEQGACCPIGRVQAGDSILFISADYANSRTISMATDGAVGGYCAFRAENIVEVARQVRNMHPDAHILICSNDDYLLTTRAAEWMLSNFKVDRALEIDGLERVIESLDGAVLQVMATWRKDARSVPYIWVDVRSGRGTRIGMFVNEGVSHSTAAARAVGNASIVCPRFSARGENKWTDFNDLHVNESLDAVRAQLAAAMLAALNPNTEALQVSAAPAPEAMADNVVPLHSKKKKVKKAATTAGAEGGDVPDWVDQVGAVADNSDRWQRRLARSEKGNILPTLSNVFLILTNHKDWSGVLAYDEFSGQVVKLRNPPFAGAECGEWSDMDDMRCLLWMQQQYGFAPRQDAVMSAVVLAADLCKFHVVRNYLDPLVWDGQPRLDAWLVSCLGAENSLYNRTVARKWLIAAVARVYRPGCKADNVLILEGEQGIYKSTALKVLGGDWFTDAPFRMGDKDAYVVIRGKWIVELAELDSFNKADSTGAKLFFGQYIDRYRTFYGKRAADVPRQQVFAGTTNSDAYLKDDTGNRRYWPVKVTTVDLEGLKAIRDQLWAEARAAFEAGDAWWPTSDEKEMFEGEQDERYVGDAYIAEIREWLVGKNQCTMPEILREALKLDVAKWTRPEQQRVGRCMAEMKWHRKRGAKGSGGKRDWVYVRPDAEGGAGAGDDDGPL